MVSVRRRQFLISGALLLVTGVLVVAAPPLFAQTAKPVRIGWLGFGIPATAAVSQEIFRQGMDSLGYIDGTQYVLESRLAEGRIDRLPALAAELVQLPVDIILALGTLSALAAKKVTSTIPIVMVGVGDPVGSGLVKSLSRPGGNITGMSDLLPDLSAKTIELFVEGVPKLTKVAVMVNEANPVSVPVMKDIVAAARKVGLDTSVVRATTVDEIERGFSAATHKKVGAIILAADILFLIYRDKIAELAVKQDRKSVV